MKYAHEDFTGGSISTCPSPIIPKPEPEVSCGPIEKTLRDAMALIADPVLWCQGSLHRPINIAILPKMALTDDGSSTVFSITSMAKLQYCSVGALRQSIYGSVRARPRPDDTDSTKAFHWARPDDTDSTKAFHCESFLIRALIELGVNWGIETVSIAHYNDFHNHQDVMRMWDRAINIAHRERA